MITTSQSVRRANPQNFKYRAVSAETARTQDFDFDDQDSAAGKLRRKFRCDGRLHDFSPVSSAEQVNVNHDTTCDAQPL